ncbi:MAG: hypothetical protein V1721_05260 [Pseudomonadota bacterium]
MAMNGTCCSRSVLERFWQMKNFPHQLKNFPHQFSNLDKFTDALGVANVLIGERKNINDDGIFGEALTYASVYNFRGLVGSVIDRVVAEKQKDLSDQGFRTAARDIRRFFIIADLIVQNGNTFSVTRRGQDILHSIENVILRNALWREAMLQMRLDSGGNVSHPYRILLKLVADNVGIETPKLLLALEAQDDSPEEYARISALVALDTQGIIDSLGISEANAKNAIKILPAIAEQVGDITRLQGRVIFRAHMTSTEDSLLEEIEEGERTQPAALTSVRPEDISPLPRFSPAAESTVNLSAAIEMRKRRTIMHHKAVISIAQLLGRNGYTTYESPFDCLGHKARKGGILVEVKTLDGSRPDERRQTEKALGQLKGYNYFNVPSNLKLPRFVEVAAFSEQPDKKTIGFMQENRICPAWQREDHWLTADRAGNTVNLSPDALLS